MDRLAVQRHLVDVEKMYDDVADELCNRHSEVIVDATDLLTAIGRIILSEKARLGSNSLPFSYFNPDA